MPELATRHTCTGCVACVDKCPHKAITSFIQSDGHRYVEVNHNLCVECKLCEKVCPKVNGFSYGENTLKSDFFAGWSKSETIRRRGATSGLFGAIAISFIENGGMVCGAVMDGLECVYIITDSLNDIDRIQGSKYTSSDPRGIYKEILQRLKEDRKILFSGLPCHVAALLCYIPKKYGDNLFTVDLICGGVPSLNLINKFKETHPDIKTIVSFRDKSQGWKPDGFRYTLTYENMAGEKIRCSGRRNLITDGFACELTDRYSCYNCNFAFSSRKSDITIGDLWKDKIYSAQHFDGVSSIIAHSEKGEKLLKDSNIEFKKHEAGLILKANRRLYNGFSYLQWFPERRMMVPLFRWLRYKTLLKIYGSDISIKDILWMPFGAYRKLSFKLCELLNNHRNKKILKRIK